MVVRVELFQKEGEEIQEGYCRSRYSLSFSRFSLYIEPSIESIVLTIEEFTCQALNHELIW